MQKVIKKIKRESNKLAAISAVWLVVILATSIMLGDNETFIQLLPVLCLGGFLTIAIEIYTTKLD